MRCCLVGVIPGSFCNPIDCNLSGSSFHGILHGRILEWVAISFSVGSSLPRDLWAHLLSSAQLWNQLFLREDLVPFSDEGLLEAKIWMLSVLLDSMYLQS